MPVWLLSTKVFVTYNMFCNWQRPLRSKHLTLTEIVATWKLKHHSSYVYVYHSMSLYNIFIQISIDGTTYQREHIASYWKDADSGREWGNCGCTSVSNSVCVWYMGMWLRICVVKPVIEEVFWFQVVVNGNVNVWPLAKYFLYVYVL